MKHFELEQVEETLEEMKELQNKFIRDIDDLLQQVSDVKDDYRECSMCKELAHSNDMMGSCCLRCDTLIGDALIDDLQEIEEIEL